MYETSDTIMTIDVISDVVCPWCYIGKKRLDAARKGIRAAVFA